MAINQIKPFALGELANVLTPAEYEALAALRSMGFSAGVAPSKQLNTVWRQSSFIAASIAAWLEGHDFDVLDDGDVAGLVAKFEQAILLTGYTAPGTGAVVVPLGTALGSAVHVRSFGATGAGNESAKIQAAIKAAYEAGATWLIFDPNVEYEIEAAVFFNSYGVLTRSLNVVGMRLKLTAPTAGGAVVTVGRGADVGNAGTIERTGRVILHSPQIDGGTIAGENGIGLARAEDVLILNPVIKNCKRDYVGSREGGRAITAHGRCRDVTVINHRALNCSDAFHVSHNPDYTATDSGNTTITGVTLGNPTIISVASNTFAVGEFVTTYGVGGTTGLNPTYSFLPQYEVIATAGNNVTINLDSTGYGAWTAGGNIVRADLTDGGRSPAIRVMGMHAEDCEYSLINVEGANYPRTISPVQTVFFSDVTAKNCGTTATRGLINGNNACGVQIKGLAAVNDSGHPVQSIVRGSFQASTITGTYDIHTLTGSVIDADPTTENPASTGIDAGIGTHPYGTSCDNTYDIKLLCRGDQTQIDALIHAADLAGTSIDRFYRNDINIVISGLAEGARYTGVINDIAMHLSNRVRVLDLNNGHLFEGPLTTAGQTLNSGNSAREFGGVNYGRAEWGIRDTGSGTTTLKALDTGGTAQGEIRYTFADNRYRVYLGGVQYWQFTVNNILPNTDNTLDFGAPALRGRTAYFGTGAINTSDEREKTPAQPIDAAVLRAWAKVEFVQFKFLDAVELKGDGARWHFGVIAQRVKEAFESEGLDPFAYGVLCYDEWPDTYEPVLDGAGEPTGELRLVVPAGNRYGIRYDEALALECAYLRSRL